MGPVENQIISTFIFAIGAVSLVLLVISRQWYLELRPPKYRQLRWEDVDYLPLWREWFAWRPIRTVSGRVMWWETVYRNIGNGYVDYDDWTWYHYGDLMDVLKETK